jgi:hypothetical protein
VARIEAAQHLGWLEEDRASEFRARQPTVMQEYHGTMSNVSDGNSCNVAPTLRDVHREPHSGQVGLREPEALYA